MNKKKKRELFDSYLPNIKHQIFADDMHIFNVHRTSVPTHYICFVEDMDREYAVGDIVCIYCAENGSEYVGYLEKVIPFRHNGPFPSIYVALHSKTMVRNSYVPSITGKTIRTSRNSVLFVESEDDSESEPLTFA